MKTVLFEKLNNGAVKCTACSHYCKIPEGKTGICGVRKNEKGELHLLTYGKPTGLQIDHIEKKPLYHFLPGTEILSLGTIGCNFSCDFCQNWQMSQRPKLIKESVEKHLKDYREFSPEMIVDIAKERGVPSIAFTYNEPTVFFEYAFDIAKLAHKNGIKTVFVSNGFMSGELLEKIDGYLDGINIDLKSFSDKFYLKICKGKLEPVLDNIKKIYDMGIWVELTTLLIPSVNDSPKELGQIAEFIAGIDDSIPWHITAFNPNFRMTDVPQTSVESLIKAHKIGKEAGLKHIYIGNAPVKEHEQTYCPKCKSIIIERDYPVFASSRLKNGKCECGEEIKGVWK